MKYLILLFLFFSSKSFSQEKLTTKAYEKRYFEKVKMAEDSQISVENPLLIIKKEYNQIVLPNQYQIINETPMQLKRVNNNIKAFFSK